MDLSLHPGSEFLDRLLGFLWGMIPTVVLGTVGLVVLASLMYFLPLYSVHLAMRKKKLIVLEEIAQEYDRFDQRWRQALADQSRCSDDLPKELLDAMQKLHEAFQRAAGMPEWPFSIAGLSRFAGLVLIPILLTLLSNVFRRVF